MRKKLIFFIIMLLANPVFAIKILRPGVKINSTKITATMYLLTETEVASFTAWKIKNDFYKRELERKAVEIKLYKDFNKELINKFTAISGKYMQASDKLMRQIDERIKDRRRAARARRHAGFLGILKGLLYSGIIQGATKIFK